MRGAIAGKKGIIADPAGHHKSFAQQRQYNMAAAEHECAGAVEGFEEIDRLRVYEAAQDRKSGEQQKEHGECRDTHGTRDRHCDMSGRCRRPGAAEP